MFNFVPGPPRGSRGSRTVFPFGIRRFWAVPGSDLGGNVFLLCILALSTAGIRVRPDMQSSQPLSIFGALVSPMGFQILPSGGARSTPLLDLKRPGHGQLGAGRSCRRGKIIYKIGSTWVKKRSRLRRSIFWTYRELIFYIIRPLRFYLKGSAHAADP